MLWMGLLSRIGMLRALAISEDRTRRHVGEMLGGLDGDGSLHDCRRTDAPADRRNFPDSKKDEGGSEKDGEKVEVEASAGRERGGGRGGRREFNGSMTRAGATGAGRYKCDIEEEIGWLVSLLVEV